MVVYPESCHGASCSQLAPMGALSVPPHFLFTSLEQFLKCEDFKVYLLAGWVALWEAEAGELLCIQGCSEL